MRGRQRSIGLGAALASGIALLSPVVASNGTQQPSTPPLTIEQKAEFLRSAEVVNAEPIGRGITEPWRLTLSDGTITHDAALNVVDKRSAIERFVDGTFELNFVDSYRFNIAAFHLAGLLGLEDFIPVTVERRWKGKVGALSWWIDEAMEEGERLRQRLAPPDPQAWNRQIYRVRLFNNLVYDSDRNLGNMLVTRDWHAWLIDFTRAFRTWDKLPAQSDLQMVEGEVLERLRGLTFDAIEERTRPYLLENEIDALLERRDLIVEHFDQLIAERGRGAVVH